MNEKELKDLQDSIKLEQKKQFDAIEALKAASDSQKTELNGKIGASEKALKTLGEQLDAIQLEMKDKSNFREEKDSFIEMKKKWNDKTFTEGLKAKGGKASFELKAIMDTDTNLSGSAFATAVVVPFREQGIKKAPDRIPTLLDLVSRGTINSDMLTWVERSARTASAAAVSEGSAYAQSDMTYIMKSKGVERIGHYIKVQNRSLDDWDALMSEINLELFTGLERILESYVYSGTGMTPQLQGIIDVCAAYSSTGLDDKVVTPNHFDAIRAAIMQLRQAEYQATAAFINPADGAAMDMPKNADGIYLLPPFMSANGTVVKGVSVYESNLVTAGDLLVGDFKRSQLFLRKGIEIRIFEQNENDALYDRKTITASLRGVNRISVPDYNAFVYDTFDDIIAAIKA